MSIGIGTRYSLLDSHFAHIDDIGVAKTILDRREYMSDAGGRYDKWRLEVLNGDKGNTAKNIGKFLDDNSILEQTAYFFVWWRSILHAVPASWTYAPGQFYLTNILIDSEHNYSELKFFGRLPSFIFNILAIILLPVFFIRIYGINKGLINSTIAVTLLSLSWENIIHSAQMESYAVGSFSILLIFFFLLKILNSPPRFKKPWFKIGMLVAIPGMLQYQALFFLPALFITLMLFLKNNISVMNLIKYSSSAFSGFFIIFIFFILPYLKGDINSGVHWNAGPNEIFILNPNWDSGLLSGTVETVVFLFNISIEVIEAMLSPISYSMSNGVIGWLLAILCIIGVISMSISPNTNKKAIVVFSALSFLTLFILLLAQVIPLSPTRHSIILGVFAIIFITEAIMNLGKIFHTYLGNLKINIALTLSVSLWTGMFLLSLNNELTTRSDPFNEEEIYQRLQEDKIDIVTNYDGSNQMYLMPSIRNKYPILDAAIFMGGDHDELNLDQKLNTIVNYGIEDLHIRERKMINLAYISGNNCFEEDLNNRIKQTKQLLGSLYFFNNIKRIKVVKAECKNIGAYKEWSPRTTMPSTSNGRNLFSYNVIQIYNK
ncbi:MAG: hypothetical protein ISR69_05400 [Gammaproteobacteria bacterium]|nr:hypothetical protein [Gammaproteobacteria bacterium]